MNGRKNFQLMVNAETHLAQLRWPNGFQYPHCGHDHGYFITTRSHYECGQYPANYGLERHVTHIAKVTPPEKSTEWRSWVHIAIAN